MNVDMVYDGQRLTWTGHGVFNASSGLTGFQKPREQCLPDKGPIPEGTYHLLLVEDTKLARDDGTGRCNLAPSAKIQRIPRGAYAEDCEPMWANWGVSRVRLHANDETTAKKCSIRRDGFYLHDSIKGYSHGCIEVETTFFDEIRSFIAGIKARRLPKKDRLVLQVRYVAERETNGGTRKIK